MTDQHTTEQQPTPPVHAAETAAPTASTKPWYRKAWPWVLIAIGVVVSLAVALTIWIGAAATLGDTRSDSRGSSATNPGTDDEADAGDANAEPASAADEPAKPTAEDPVLGETAFGFDSHFHWYAVTIENPNTDYIFRSAPISIEAVAADGTILDSSSNYTTLLQGTTVVSGIFTSIGTGTIDHLEVRGPVASGATHQPAAETGSMTTSDVTVSSEYSMTTATGTVTSSFAEDQEYVEVTVLARDASGAIIAAEDAYIERLPAGGTAQFEAMFFELGAAASFEAHAHL